MYAYRDASSRLPIFSTGSEGATADEVRASYKQNPVRALMYQDVQIVLTIYSTARFCPENLWTKLSSVLKHWNPSRDDALYLSFSHASPSSGGLPVV